MKRRTYNIGWLLFFMSVGSVLFAQDEHIRSQGYWTLGLNGGWAYQQSDARAAFNGYGLGLTLAKNLAYRPGAPLSFDLRGRFLYADTYGLDGERSTGILNNTAINGTGTIDYATDPGFVYYNHNTKIGELALEGVLHLNRLRERSHFDISVFGGIGLDYYKTTNNWLNGNAKYNFTVLDANAARSDLRSLLDDSYETDAQGFEDGGKFEFMPSLGAELYYWFTPKFALGVAHKATWATTDDLDGQVWAADNTPTAENDLYHYTSIGAKWIIDPHRRVLSEPLIKIIDPPTNPYTSPVREGFVRAEIQYATADQVRCRVNGRDVRFNMYNENFSVDFPLKAGRNEVLILATNEVGRAIAEQVIIFDNTYTPPPPPRGDKPFISFRNPPERRYNSATRDFRLEAFVENVSNSRDIALSLNDRAVRDFNFDTQTNLLRANLRLRAGRNVVEVRATNQFGTTTELVSIQYQSSNANPNPTTPPPPNVPPPPPPPSVPRPQVRITNVSAPNPSNCQSRVRADIRHVSSYRDVAFAVNGQRLGNFEYNANTGRFDAVVNLREGQNTIEIEVRNPRGRANDSERVRCTPSVLDNTNTGSKPSVNITTPGNQSTTTNDRTAAIVATVRNVDAKNDITFLVNGQRNTNFTYSANTDKFSATVNLKSGNNDIIIKAVNKFGTAQDGVGIRYISQISTPTPPPPPPPPPSPKPSVAFTQPQNNATVETARQIIKARVKNAQKGDLRFTLNGSRITNFSLSGTTFSATVNLKEGTNNLQLKATNDGGTDAASLRVTFKKKEVVLPRPLVEIINPRGANSSTNKGQIQIKGRVQHVKSKRDIRLQVNRKILNDFDFDTKTGIVTATTPLNVGKNAITLTGTNASGSARASTTVTYQKPETSRPPIVEIQSVSQPVIDPLNPSAPQSTVIATIRYVTSKRDVTFTLNGKSVNDFEFRPKSDFFKATIDLASGQNVIVVQARNSDGIAKDTYTVNY